MNDFLLENNENLLDVHANNAKDQEKQQNFDNNKSKLFNAELNYNGN